MVSGPRKTGAVPIVLVFVSVDDRLPGEEVSLNFNATEEVLDKFLNVLEQSGLRFSCSDLIPGLIKTCRVEPDRAGLEDIGADGYVSLPNPYCFSNRFSQYKISIYRLS
jgi:hypothetical protein